MTSFLNKEELINSISQDLPKLKKVDIERVLNAMQGHVIDAVCEGREVKISGFLTFKPRIAAARDVKTPAEGKTVHVPEHLAVSIKPLKTFNDKLEEVDTDSVK